MNDDMTDLLLEAEEAYYDARARHDRIPCVSTERQMKKACHELETVERVAFGWL